MFGLARLYCIIILRNLRERIKKERRGKLTSGILLQHDNATPHTSQKTKAVINKIGFELMPHPPYSPDLAPSDYWLFEEMRRPLRGKRFSNFDELQTAVNTWVKGTPKRSFFPLELKSCQNDGINVIS